MGVNERPLLSTGRFLPPSVAGTVTGFRRGVPPMRIRRCAVVYLEPREQAQFDLGVLLAGGDGLQRTRRWLVYAQCKDRAGGLA